MNRIIRGASALMIAALLLASCKPDSKEAKVMARAVPERADDFIFENDLVCYRAYGEALEGNPTSPGLDLWVKTPGGLVADQRYKDELENGKSYHKDWGNGKDCYKVAVSLGAGSSSPLVAGQIIYPATNYRSYEILSQNEEEIVFVLHYPAWDVDGHQVALDRKITVMAGTYFCMSEDTYTGDFEALTIAAGIFTHEVEESCIEADRFAIWEHASDTSVEPEDGMIGVGIIFPEETQIVPLETGVPHLAGIRNVKPGDTVTYWFGSCWTKGDIKTAADWFDLVKTK